MTTGVVNLDDSLYVAVQRLHGAPDTAPADKLRAIARLRAPGVTLPADLASASLVAALSDGDDGVRAAAATACLERFDKLAAAPPDQAALLDGLLRGITTSKARPPPAPWPKSSVPSATGWPPPRPASRIW